MAMSDSEGEERGHDSSWLGNLHENFFKVELPQGNAAACMCGTTCCCEMLARPLRASEVSVLRAGLKGYGLFCGQAITKGSFITEFWGELCRETDLSSNGDYSIGLQSCPGLFLDSGRYGGKARMPVFPIRHSSSFRVPIDPACGSLE